MDSPEDPTGAPAVDEPGGGTSTRAAAADAGAGVGASAGANEVRTRWGAGGWGAGGLGAGGVGRTPYASATSATVSIRRLFLSGGGVSGTLILGALHELFGEHELPAGVVELRGTSVGAVIATLLAAGATVDGVIHAASTTRIEDLLELSDGGPLAGVHGGGAAAISSGARFQALMDEHLGALCGVPLGSTWGELGARVRARGRRLAVCLTDLERAVPVLATSDAGDRFASCPASRVVLASCAIPLAFQPVALAGGLFVDGGVLADIPMVVGSDAPLGAGDLVIRIVRDPLAFRAVDRGSLVDAWLRLMELTLGRVLAAQRLEQASLVSGGWSLEVPALPGGLLDDASDRARVRALYRGADCARAWRSARALARGPAEEDGGGAGHPERAVP